MALNPLLNLCMCLICEMQGSLKFNTVSFLMCHFLAAIKALYCQVTDIKPSRDVVLTENVDKCLAHLAEQAFKHMVNNVSYFELDLPNEDSNGIEIWEPIFKFGLLNSVPQSKLAHKWYFTNRAFQEYLSGWHVSQMNEETFTSFLNTLLNDKHMHNVCMYYCGLLRFDNNSSQLNILFHALAEVNQDQWRATPTTSPFTKRGFTMTTVLSPSGRLSDFSLSLRCVSEVDGREDLIKPLLTSFPPRLSMRPREVPDIRVISGLAKILRTDSASIAELELRLDHFAKYHEYTFLLLAAGIEHSCHVTSLKLYWTDEELLALFLANVFDNNQSIKMVR